MPRLSNKRRAHALLYGEAVARSHLQEFAEHPERFGNSLENLAGLVGRMAPVGLFMSCKHTPSQQEKDLAGESATKAVELVLRVVETCNRIPPARSGE